MALLGPKPAPHLPPVADAPPASNGQAAEPGPDADAAMTDAAAPSAAADLSADVEGMWSGRLLTMVRAKAQAADVAQWAESNALKEVFGGSEGLIKVCVAFGTCCNAYQMHSQHPFWWTLLHTSLDAFSASYSMGVCNLCCFTALPHSSWKCKHALIRVDMQWQDLTSWSCCGVWCVQQSHSLILTPSLRPSCSPTDGHARAASCRRQVSDAHPHGPGALQQLAAAAVRRVPGGPRVCSHVGNGGGRVAGCAAEVGGHRGQVGIRVVFSFTASREPGSAFGWLEVSLAVLYLLETFTTVKRQAAGAITLIESHLCQAAGLVQ